MNRRIGWSILGSVIVALGVVVLLVWRNEALAQQRAAAADGGHMVVVDFPSADQGGHVVVVNTRGQTMAVYHVDPLKGEISLRSVRNIRWDMVLDEFNTNAPKPSDVRAMVDQR